MRVLFLCTGNSCRSQMAEAWANTLLAGQVEAYSAGVERHGLNPRMLTVMAEAGVDMTGHASKTVDDLPVKTFDLVVTLCDHARESCPFFPGTAKRVHHGFDDPPSLTTSLPEEEDKLEVYRRVRDEIRAYVQTLPDIPENGLGEGGSPAP